MIETIRISGVISREELMRAWISSPTDPVGDMPTEPARRTTLACRYRGRVLPGFYPGYTQKTPVNGGCVDESECVWWERVVGSLFRHGGELIVVCSDYSGSNVSVRDILPPTAEIPPSAHGETAPGFPVIGHESGSNQPRIYTTLRGEVGYWSCATCSGWQWAPAPSEEAEWLLANGYVRQI